jgi:hypothetical protein
VALDCEHCRKLRGFIEAENERLGRPVDSLDKGDVIPHSAIPKVADVQACACECHAHLIVIGRWSRK